MSDPHQEPPQRGPLVETLTITNTGTTPCRLGGPETGFGSTANHPVLRVDALTADKIAVLTAVGSGGNSTLAPGKSATTTISTDSTYGLDDDRCLPKQINAFWIDAPADVDAVVVAATPRPVCTNLKVSPRSLVVGGLPGPPG